MQASLSYDINNQLEAGVLYSYDDYFESRVSGNLTWRFNSHEGKPDIIKSSVLHGLSASPNNRNVRVANSKRNRPVSETGIPYFSSPNNPVLPCIQKNTPPYEWICEYSD